MAEFSIDRFVDLYAERAAGMSASEVRALFAVASRPEVVSLAGGMPYVQALPPEDVLAVVAEVLDDHGSTILQYGGGQGHLSLARAADRRSWPRRASTPTPRTSWSPPARSRRST